MPHNPETDGPFGEWMRGGKPLGQGRTVDVITDEPTWVTKDQVREGTTPDGGRYRRVTDQLGNDVTEETTPSGRQRKHVKIRLR